MWGRSPCEAAVAQWHEKHGALGEPHVVFWEDVNCQGATYPREPTEQPLWDQSLTRRELGLTRVMSYFVPSHVRLELRSPYGGFLVVEGSDVPVSNTSAELTHLWRAPLTATHASVAAVPDWGRPVRWQLWTDHDGSLPDVLSVRFHRSHSFAFHHVETHNRLSDALVSEYCRSPEGRRSRRCGCYHSYESLKALSLHEEIPVDAWRASCQPELHPVPGQALTVKRQGRLHAEACAAMYQVATLHEDEKVWQQAPPTCTHHYKNSLIAHLREIVTPYVPGHDLYADEEGGVISFVGTDVDLTAVEGADLTGDNGAKVVSKSRQRSLRTVIQRPDLETPETSEPLSDEKVRKGLLEVPFVVEVLAWWQWVALVVFALSLCGILLVWSKFMDLYLSRVRSKRVEQEAARVASVYVPWEARAFRLE